MSVIHEKVQLATKNADSYIIPLGPVSLVCVVTDIGMVSCAAFDVEALNKFGYPAAQVKSAGGEPIATIDDLLEGVVKHSNIAAFKFGVKPGMSGREALDRM